MLLLRIIPTLLYSVIIYFMMGLQAEKVRREAVILIFFAS
jgi:hypothetical protein